MKLVQFQNFAVTPAVRRLAKRKTLSSIILFSSVCAVILMNLIFTPYKGMHVKHLGGLACFPLSLHLTEIYNSAETVGGKQCGLTPASFKLSDQMNFTSFL